VIGESGSGDTPSRVPLVEVKEHNMTAATEDFDSTDSTNDIEVVTDHRAHERWGPEVKEKALALFAAGYSLRKTAQALGVPYSTLRAFKISDDPIAEEIRARKLAELIEDSWSVAEEMLERVRAAPVAHAQQAAVAYGIVVEKAILAQAHQSLLKSAGTKQTMADFMTALRAEQAQRAQLVPRPQIVEGAATPKK
jgi:transposase-like protein